VRFVKRERTILPDGIAILIARPRRLSTIDAPRCDFHEQFATRSPLVSLEQLCLILTPRFSGKDRDKGLSSHHMFNFG